MSHELRVASFLTTKEAAEVIGVSRRTILAAISDGKLRAAKPGKGYLIRDSWLDEYLDVMAGIEKGVLDD